MLASAVVSGLPLRIDDRSLADFNDAIAGAESNGRRGLHQFNVRPLILMVVNVVGDLAKQKAIYAQNAIGFLDKGRVEVGKAVSVLLRRASPQSKTHRKILLVVLALIRHMRGIVDHYIKAASRERHSGVVAHN